jgi:hypothetical protein
MMNEARELGQAHRERLLATFEAGALAATGTGKLALGTATSGGAVAGTRTTTDALARLSGALRGAKIIKLHVG